VYERLRESVKGPEDLEREMKNNEQMADLKFALETEPVIKESLKKNIKEDIDAHGIDSVLESSAELGNFDIAIETNPETHQDQLVVLPEGNVSEHIPVTIKFNDKYISQLSA